MPAASKGRPADEHDARLVANVRPEDWSNPRPAARYNLAVIGAGTAGLVTASAAAQMGAKVALIERDLLGGDCLNAGCVPSKGIISAARAAGDARSAGRLGVAVGDVEPRFAEVMERMRRLRAKISAHDAAQRFADLGVDVFFGEAKFAGPAELAVGDVAIKFKKAVIATGARAAAPPIPGLEDVEYLTNESIFSLTERPRRLGIIGGGPIGCELAQAFRRLGSEVWLVESQEHVLGREDPDAARIVADAMKRDGVNILCSAEDLELRQDGGTRLSVRSGGKSHDPVVDAMLVAAGRQPNVEGLDLEAAGVRYHERRGVEVDDRLRTSNPDVFAAGDVCSKYRFTHAADFMARIVLRNALFFGRSKLSDLVIPWCTYTSPEVAHVGLSPEDAEKDGVEIDTYELALEDVDRATLDGETEGFVKIHTRKGKDEILGATIVASHAGDMISTISLAMTNGIGLGGIANTIFPYPTQAEAIRKAGDAYNRTRLTPLVKSVMERWLRWRR